MEAMNESNGQGQDVAVCFSERGSGTRSNSRMRGALDVLVAPVATKVAAAHRAAVRTRFVFRNW